MSVLSLTDAELAGFAIGLLDLTSLNDLDTEADITALCESAAKAKQLTHVNVAALCIYPRFIPWAKQELQRLGLENVKVATVSNFPHGRNNIEAAVAETQACLAYGADEVDVVFPYQSLLAGDEQVGLQLVQACKHACGPAVLKVIIETGELKSADMIHRASQIAIQAGADFIKTSTGKVPVNATPEAARVMLECIKKADHRVCFKPAGGVKTLADAKDYFRLVETILGDEALTPERFRFGASSLLASLLLVMGHSINTVSPSHY
ncbi:deoxyribose-phosphate aldolase [Marinomonas sp. 15G1-11]|uniref:Deoxyribose-phosphate aldolase n=1 Tax=Marinomonas phaeophyticola TaxID=3004091 RepID=A0ABT4JZ37_9GAMM|nr:deoxyribose-phosphate aldolase [Marinomonas sp. 15G1-11]MCZ2723650.1 deoxyribose-phosphate aldolase [Marinomonas sp. 15G1-11]